MILNNVIEIKTTNKNIGYYKSLGFDIKSGEIIKVNVSQLSKGSKQKIIASCDICGGKKEMCYKDYLRIVTDNNYYCSKCKNIKTIETVKSKYNVDNVFKSDIIKDKIRKTIKDKYNVDFYQQTEEFKEKVKKTNFKKFGVSYPLQNSDVKNKVDFSKTKEQIDKMIFTYNKNYSVIFIDKSKLIHNDKYDYSNSNYVNMTTKVRIDCTKHGAFYQRPMDHINSKQGCPICKESKGEATIRQYLLDNDINFVSQIKFEDCVYKYALVFDFYLQDKNICIEYDGIQHYEIFDIFGGEIGFKIRKERDEIKNEYCKNNNIRLERIRYDENVLQRLDEILIIKK